MNLLQGVANRGASIRVGRETEQNGKGEIPTLFSFTLLLTLISLSLPSLSLSLLLFLSVLLSTSLSLHSLSLSLSLSTFICLSLYFLSTLFLSLLLPRLLRRSQAGFQHGSLRGHVHDSRNHHSMETMIANSSKIVSIMIMIIIIVAIIIIIILSSIIVLLFSIHVCPSFHAL